jgi:hypothetical protein
VHQYWLTGDSFMPDADVFHTLRYAADFKPKLREALNLMAGVAMQHLDEIVDEEDACPGCGCKAGDGRTDGCKHPDGCGYFDALTKG